MPRRAGGQREQAGIADIIEIVACAVAPRAGLSVAGDRAIDKPRIARAQGLVTEPEPIHDARPELLDHNVAASGEIAHALARSLVLQVDGDAFLAAIEHREGRADAAPWRRIAAHFF